MSEVTFLPEKCLIAESLHEICNNAQILAVVKKYIAGSFSVNYDETIV